MREGGGRQTSRSNRSRVLGSATFARPDQLDGAGTLQKLVFGQVNLAHTAAADLAAEVTLAELPGLGNRRRSMKMVRAPNASRRPG